MIHQETTNAWKAGLLLVLGAVFGLIGMVLIVGGRSSAAQTVAQEAAPIARFLSWAPTTLLAAGGTLAAAAAVVLGRDWFRRKA